MKFGLGYDWKEVKRFKKLDKKDRSIIFYLENECDFIVFKPIVEKLTQEYDIKICYVTSSKTDPMLTSNDKNILPFVSAKKNILVSKIFGICISTKQYAPSAPSGSRLFLSNVVALTMPTGAPQWPQ